jgi:hypothetical protein
MGPTSCGPTRFLRFNSFKTEASTDAVLDRAHQIGKMQAAIEIPDQDLDACAVIEFLAARLKQRL